MGIALSDLQWAPGFADIGVTAFTTTKAVGSFALMSDQPSDQVFGRWLQLAELVGAPRLAFAHQVHGIGIEVHEPGWRGLLRVPDSDGHLALRGHTAMAVSLADCVPIFVAHPSGVAGVLHSGWKGTAGRIVQRAVGLLKDAGVPVGELLVHCGPAICGDCYEVGPEVYGQVTGRSVDRPTRLDLRAQIAQDARAVGVRDVTISDQCTRCHNGRFFSHRAGDAGRQLGVIVGRSGESHLP